MGWRRSSARVVARISEALGRFFGFAREDTARSIGDIQLRLDELERRVDELATGHRQLAHSAQEHLAALQAASDLAAVARRGFDAEIGALRQALAAVEACLGDLERSQGRVSAALTRHGLTKIPE